MEDLMNTITANELKTSGIAAIGEEETVVFYRGKPKYLILPESQIEAYEAFRLDRALKLVQSDVEAGRYSTNLEKHLREIDNV
jgi:hypothetical protein